MSYTSLMSNQRNTELLERAYELLEEFDSHPSKIDKALKEAIDTNDLEGVLHLVHYLEAFLAEEHFHNWDLMPEGDY